MELISKTQCLRCEGKMESIGVEKIQLGQTGWLSNVSNLLAGALEVEIFICNKCGKIEFFQEYSSEVREGTDKIEQVNCPRCGRKHDMDYPKCPFCKYDYNAK